LRPYLKNKLKAKRKKKKGLGHGSSGRTLIFEVCVCVHIYICIHTYTYNYPVLRGYTSLSEVSGESRDRDTIKYRLEKEMECPEYRRAQT
jgi:hypothetical protein